MNDTPNWDNYDCNDAKSYCDNSNAVWAKEVWDCCACTCADNEEAGKCMKRDTYYRPKTGDLDPAGWKKCIPCTTTDCPNF